MSHPDAGQRLVVKIGTSVLTGGTPRPDQPRMVELARQCALLHASDYEVVICTSGAIAFGRERLGFPALAPTLANKQMLAAVGQSRLMQMWERFFSIYGVDVGQILLTRADAENRGRFLNARDTINALLENRIIPVINENDAVATDEIKLGDNDTLSALVAVMIDAGKLIMLTDQPGLYTADPRTHADATLIAEVRHIDDTLRRLAGDSSTGLGVGGMATKLQAADLARRAGTEVVITSGHAEDAIVRAATGRSTGTSFPALAQPLENRKRWILAGPRPSGAIVVDDGAVTALGRDGSSLLPAGIIEVEGVFARGDTVRVLSRTGLELARGISRYDGEDLRRIRGCQSPEIIDRLGYAYGPVAIHRNDMIILIREESE